MSTGPIVPLVTGLVGGTKSDGSEGIHRVLTCPEVSLEFILRWSLDLESAVYDVSTVSGILPFVKKVGRPSECTSTDVSREWYKLAGESIHSRGTCFRSAASIAGAVAGSSDSGALR